MESRLIKRLAANVEEFDFERNRWNSQDLPSMPGDGFKTDLPIDLELIRQPLNYFLTNLRIEIDYEVSVLRGARFSVCVDENEPTSM